MKNFTLELRDAAQRCTHIDYRALIRIRADDLSVAIDQFCAYPNKHNMSALNGAWATAARVLKDMPPEGDDAPVSGAPSATVFATEPKRMAA